MVSSRIENGHFCFAQTSFIFFVVRFSIFFKMQQAEFSHPLILSSRSDTSNGTENNFQISFAEGQDSVFETLPIGREDEHELIECFVVVSLGELQVY